MKYKFFSILVSMLNLADFTMKKWTTCGCKGSNTEEKLFQGACQEDNSLPIYPEHIRDDLPNFVDWLNDYTTSLIIQMHGVQNVDVEVRRLSEFPSVHAESFKHMWTYGNHYRVEDEGVEVGYVTQDYGIACSFGAEDGRTPSMNTVGVLKEIIVVRYSARRRVVMKGSWIQNSGGECSSTRTYKYGFTVVRYNNKIAATREPYVLPAIVHQVCLFKINDFIHVFLFKGKESLKNN